MAAASKRLIKELAEHQNDPNPHLGRLGPVDDDDLMHWTAELLGPRDTPYEGCRWEIDIKISERYPQEPPEMRFKTPCCHPNVHLETGEICLDLLRGTAWTPAYTISAALTQVYYLLSQPNALSPLNVDVSGVLRNGDTVAYESLVRLWGVLHAGKPPTLGGS